MYLCWQKEDFVGKQIKDLCNLINYKGIAIFDLNKGNSNHGERIWEEAFMSDFIKEFPEYENAIVYDYNNFFGEIVLRIKLENDES